MYIFQRVLTRGTRYDQSYVSIFISSKVIREKTVLQKNAILTFYWPLQPNLLKLRQFWCHSSERAVKELSIVFSLLLIYNRFWSNGTFLKKYVILLNSDLWWPLVTSILTWAKNWPKYFRKYSLTAIEHFFPRIPIPLSFWVRTCGQFYCPPPPQGEGGWDRHPSAV